MLGRLLTSCLSLMLQIVDIIQKTSMHYIVTDSRHEEEIISKYPGLLGGY